MPHGPGIISLSLLPLPSLHVSSLLLSFFIFSIFHYTPLPLYLHFFPISPTPFLCVSLSCSSCQKRGMTAKNPGHPNERLFHQAASVQAVAMETLSQGEVGSSMGCCGKPMEVKWKSEKLGGETRFSHGLELAHGKKGRNREGKREEKKKELTGIREVELLKIFIFPHQLSGESLRDGVRESRKAVPVITRRTNCMAITELF